MTWKDRLTRREAAELERAERKRDTSRDEYNAVRRKLKSRADARTRRETAKQKEE